MNIMIKIGITGGIGSGKSVVASLFRLFGVPVYIADEESKQLTNQSETIRKQLWRGHLHPRRPEQTALGGEDLSRSSATTHREWHHSP